MADQTFTNLRFTEPDGAYGGLQHSTVLTGTVGANLDLSFTDANGHPNQLTGAQLSEAAFVYTGDWTQQGIKVGTFTALLNNTVLSVLTSQAETQHTGGFTADEEPPEPR